MSKQQPLTDQRRFILLHASRVASKIGELEESVVSHDPHVMAVTKTELTNDIAVSGVVPRMYIIIRHNRGSRGGGVALVVKKVTCAVLKAF